MDASWKRKEKKRETNTITIYRLKLGLNAEMESNWKRAEHISLEKSRQNF